MRPNAVGWLAGELHPPNQNEAKMAKRPWTDEESKRLKTFVAQGVSIIRAAAAFNRTTTGIRAQARKLGTPFPPMRVFRRQWADTPSLWR
jgi:hypothetical protein